MFYLLTLLSLLTLAVCIFCDSQQQFRAVAFWNSTNIEVAHLSFAKQANAWFPTEGKIQGFSYDNTDDWNNLNSNFLSQYDVVLFLDCRPELVPQRQAFQEYMDKGGAWMGFHYSGFSLDDSLEPQNWDWYHNNFVGSGQWVDNTWRPTFAYLRVEDGHHPATRGLPPLIKSAPNEWYNWTVDWTKNTNQHILLSIDPSSFPLGTDPSQTWHSGYYPVAWTHKTYRMVYMNMGHNDIQGNTTSDTFSSPDQNQFIRNSILWLGRGM